MRCNEHGNGHGCFYGKICTIFGFIDLLYAYNKVAALLMIAKDLMKSVTHLITFVEYNVQQIKIVRVAT